MLKFILALTCVAIVTVIVCLYVLLYDIDSALCYR